MYYFEEDHSLSQKAEDMIKLADTGGGGYQRNGDTRLPEPGYLNLVNKIILDYDIGNF